MNEEELKKLNDIKEHCLKFTEFVDPHAIEKYKMFELLENKINELEKERKHLIDLQKNMDKQYEEMEERINKAIKFIEDSYYSKNTVDIDSYGITFNKLLQVRNILKEATK